MDVKQARTAPGPHLTDEEVAAIGERLRWLRRRRETGALSTEEYTEQVRGVLERRHRVVPDHQPERRSGAGVDAAGR